MDIFCDQNNWTISGVTAKGKYWLEYNQALIDFARTKEQNFVIDDLKHAAAILDLAREDGLEVFISESQ